MKRAALGSSSTRRMRTPVIIRSSPGGQDEGTCGVVRFARMSDSFSLDRRQGPDRRNTPRGGRRPEDPTGYSPLILVADDDANSGARCVAILARLRFAVAPAHSGGEAV